MLSFLNGVLSYMTVIASSSNVYFLFSRKWIPAFVANKLFLTWSDTLRTVYVVPFQNQRDNPT